MQQGGVDSPAAVPPRKLDPRRAGFPRDDLDVSPVRELEGVGGELSSTRLRATGCPGRSAAVGGSSPPGGRFPSAIRRPVAVTEARVALTEKGTGSFLT